MAQPSYGDYLNKWTGEYCAPVVVCITTAEAEKVCLKNGLLFHELISTFGHLDGINTSVRVGGHTFAMQDAHIRFERVTELKAKSGNSVEEQLNRSFKAFDINRLPNSAHELKANPPSAWHEDIDKIFMRSMSFTDYEMISHPTLILTVISSSDIDHVSCLQELCSPHYLPPGMSNGLYDPNIQRIYLLLHDNCEHISLDPNAILSKL